MAGTEKASWRKDALLSTIVKKQRETAERVERHLRGRTEKRKAEVRK